MTEQVKVTQADRDAAQALCASAWTHAGEAFARHRIAAQAELLEALEALITMVNDATFGNDVFVKPDHSMCLSDAQAILAKAKGEV